MVNDKDILYALIGGAIGAAAAAPSANDKKELQDYKVLKKEIIRRQQKIGALPNIEKLFNNPDYIKAFSEAYWMYSYGFYRGAVIINAAIIESLLKDKYGDKDFYKLIEEAKQKGFLNETEAHFLHGIRSARNMSAHEVLKEVSEDDASLVIQITNKLVQKFI